MPNGDRLFIDEIYLPPAKLVAYCGKDLEGVHLPFNFSLLEARWDARTLATLIDEVCCPPAAGQTGCSATTTVRA